jgi:hypothetical protein
MKTQSAKQPYEAPKVTDLGSLTELTQGGLDRGSDMGGGKSPPGRGSA